MSEPHTGPIPPEQILRSRCPRCGFFTTIKLPLYDIDPDRLDGLYWKAVDTTGYRVKCHQCERVKK